jgi:hypothetical protein
MMALGRASAFLPLVAPTGFGMNRHPAPIIYSLRDVTEDRFTIVRAIIHAKYRARSAICFAAMQPAAAYSANMQS